MAPSLVDVPAKNLPTDLSPGSAETVPPYFTPPVPGGFVFTPSLQCERRRASYFGNFPKTVKPCFHKICPLLSPRVTSCHFLAPSIRPQRNCPKTHGILGGMNVTGNELRCSAGFLTCCIAGFQPAFLPRQNYYISVQKEVGGIPFPKSNKIEQNRTEMPEAHYTNHQNNRRGNEAPSSPCVSAPLRLHAFALKCFGVAQTNFDCKLSIMTITSPSTTKGK